MIWRYLRPLLLIQAIATLTSFPFLVIWGLPLSRMTIIGNIIFAPVLTLFLINSTLIFFTQLLSIPNQALCWSLEKISTLWLQTLSMGQKTWLMPVSLWSAGLLAVIIGIFIVLAFKQKKVQITTFLLLTTFSIYLFPAWTLDIASDDLVRVHKDKGTLTIKPSQNGIRIYESFFFSKYPQAEKMICFELKPLLARKFGTTTIDSIKIKSASIRTLQACTFLCQLCIVKKITIPKGMPITYKDKKQQQSFQQSLDELEKTAKQYATHLKKR
ncbi:hypothetical protein KAU11_05555 [Candidatus Babeliales bacterium]|nr:hypothetical protein [Candidatus Babeliales bacterium]